ncbi:LppX_LprAFG lipoprotein [Nocardioides sp. HDW12B]|uniref:LppX_LprAFG lipoprotein n=1 Tax=Nocardioides sp. HDW12B TaxID=2714939 RepID=UPI00140A5C7F|nr:LppX_LprAFG lipoprotein [Nocardioides sp. HDW12B]QIK66767.1 LppX_LprAFG lipoprotein [Nocardioides sp. HDW12B]
MTTYVTRARGRRGLVPALAVPLALLLTTTACSGDSGGESGDDPAAQLAEAKAALDETPGVTLSLTTDELPKGVDGVLSATGIGTHAPAFEGDIKVVVNSITVDVPVVAVEGDVYATLPFTNQFVPIDAEDYGAPDPADLLATDGGVSSWLTEVTDVTVGDEVRDGDQVLTSYAGTLPGSAVDSVIPSADEKADFPVTFTIDDDGRLAAADLTGPFYGSEGDVDYRLEISDYGTEKDIQAP